MTMKTFLIVSRRSAGDRLETYAYGRFLAVEDLPPGDSGTFRYDESTVDEAVRAFRFRNPSRQDVHAIPRN